MRQSGIFSRSRCVSCQHLDCYKTSFHLDSVALDFQMSLTFHSLTYCYTHHFEDEHVLLSFWM
ncbi:Uncharacterised protein [Vibrio cholerae]|nr:Uncharacterised protein [Vibrio cholerae]CSC88061.1 Uncharacterised protein [Vibrio cholerae]